MTEALSPFFYWTQMLLLTTSVMLLLGSVAGTYFKKHFASEGSAYLMSSPGKASKPTLERSTELRRAHRVASSQTVKLMDSEGLSTLGTAQLVNVSSTGACFSSALPLKQGESVQVFLRSAKEGLLKIPGRIVWLQHKSNSVLAGIEFKKGTPAA